MPPVAERPLRLRFEHTRYGHWGARSGYPAFVAHLDPQRFRCEKHAAADNHDDVAPWLRPLKPWLRRELGRRRMKWYKVSDLDAELAAFARCLAGRLDLVHFLDGEHSGQFLPRMLRSVGSKVRTVATFHQPPELLQQIVDPGVIRWIDHIVLMAPSQRSFFAGKIPDERVSVFLHGVDTDFFHPSPPRGERAPVRCVTVGHWLRDWTVFRAVAERVPAVEFYVVSSREIGAEDLPNVRRVSGIDDDALAHLYRAADILFLPLLDSTANNALLEGMASGLPTVTTDLEAVRAYLPAEQAILLPKGDAAACAAAVERLAADRPLRMVLGAAARARAEALSWPRVAREHETLYSRLRNGVESPARAAFALQGG